MSEDADHADRDAQILHAFADHGMECYVLRDFGHVTRATLDPEPNPWDDDVQQVDLLEDEPDGQFDLGLFHPKCTKWAAQTGISGDRDDHPNMIPRARKLAERLCDHWIIENVPGAPLDDPVTLDARTFGKGIAYRRSFETNFPLKEPPRYAPIDNAETSPHYHSERSRAWWANEKGYPAGVDVPKEHIAKNCLPVPFLRHLVKAWLEATGDAKGEGKDYSDYHEEMAVKRAQKHNQTLEEALAATDGGAQHGE